MQKSAIVFVKTKNLYPPIAIQLSVESNGVNLSVWGDQARKFLTVHFDDNEAFRHMQDVLSAERPRGNAEYLQRA
jgi:hypothetical protein